MPADKLSKIRLLLNSYKSQSNITLVEMGLLNFACSVVVPGRCLLLRLIELTSGYRKKPTTE